MKTSLGFVLGAGIGLILGLSVPFTCWRYRIETANMGADGMHMPVFVKFDRYTGAAWVSAGQTGKWHRFEDYNSDTVQTNGLKL